MESTYSFFNTPYLANSSCEVEHGVDSDSVESVDLELEDSSSSTQERGEERYPLRSRKEVTRSPPKRPSPQSCPRKRKRKQLPSTYAPMGEMSSGCFYEVTPQGKAIVGRIEEAKQIAAMLLPKNGGIRPLLLGPSGIGKHSIVIKVVEIYCTILSKSPHFNIRIFCIDCDQLLGLYCEENRSEEIIAHLKSIAGQSKKAANVVPVFYFRHIEKLISLREVADYLHLLLTQELPYIASIGGDGKGEGSRQIIEWLGEYNFSPIVVKECSVDDTRIIAQRCLSEPLNCKTFSFTEKAIDLAVSLSARHFTFRPLPIRAINILQQCGHQILLENTLSGSDQHKIAIDVDEVAAFISERVGISSEELIEEEYFDQERFSSAMREEIIGQDYAIRVMAERVSCWKMGLLNPQKPWGVFLFVGPTGVGKTELAKQLAKKLFHREESAITLDGSEYKESHTSSNLVGAPRGYEGHDLGGTLTEPLLQNPYRVVLFDEFEKAHDDVRKLFLQVFDQGRLTDRRGRVADCTKALFLLTSNLGSNEHFFKEVKKSFSPQKVVEGLKPILVEKLSPEMCGRFSAVVPFAPLDRKQLPQLAELQLKRISSYLSDQAKIHLTWDRALVDKLMTIDIDLRFGARQFCDRVTEIITTAIERACAERGKRLKGNLALQVSDAGKIILSERDEKCGF